MENARWSLNLISKIKTALGNKRAVIIILALTVIGAVLLCIPGGSGDRDENGVKNEELSEYKLRLEDELADICSSVAGVGRCRIMVTFERGAENVYKGTQLIESSPPRVSGVTVVCDGGDGSAVRGTLTEMISALFGIGKNRIAVLELKK